MSSTNFLIALAEDNQTEIARLLPTLEFTLIEVPDEAEEESGTAALTAEIDDYLALVAFTSGEHVDEFINKDTGIFEDGEDVPGFTLTGAEMLNLLPADFGILFNPESSDCFAMSPDVIEQLQNSE